MMHIFNGAWNIYTNIESVKFTESKSHYAKDEIKWGGYYLTALTGQLSF